MESKLDAMFSQWLKVRVSYKTEAEAIKAVEQNGYALRYVKDQSEAICLKAVEQNGDALRYVKDQSEAICLKAVEQNGYSLQYVKDQSEAICLKAVEQNGDALRYVKDQMFEHLLSQAPRIITKAEIAEKFGISEFEIAE